MKSVKLFLLICIILSFYSVTVFAMNPFITHIYTADPSAHVFENRVYVYPSHDRDNAIWFDMEDYHVFSSADMINWVDHGVVFSYKSLEYNSYSNSYGWVGGPEPSGDYQMTNMHPRFWAPDCAYKNGTYYFYYCARDRNIQSVKDANGYWPKEQFKIGVATSKSPCGPFIPVEYNWARDPDGNYADPVTGLFYNGQIYIPGSYSIDPCVFIDNDGSAYMVFGGQSFGGLRRGAEGPYFAQLNDDMVTFATKPVEMTNNNGGRISDWFEGSWIHKRNNMYYLSYPDDMQDHSGKSEIRYATNTSLRANGWVERGTLIPVASAEFEPAGTNHHSIVEYKGQWYAFYQNANMIGDSMKRSICVDKVYYNSNGTMKQVIITRGGVGTSAYSRIKAQFYSYMSGIGTEPCGGGDIGRRVKAIHNGDKLGYYLDFGSIGAVSFEASVASNNNDGGRIEIYRLQGDREVSLIGWVDVDYTGGWGNNVQEWITVNCDIDTTYGFSTIELRFVGGSGGLFNLNWFKFKPTAPIPVGYSVAFKSLNPNSVDNNGDIGQKYLSAHTIATSSYIYVCADRNAVNAWERFSLLAEGDGTSLNGTIQINSSRNGQNLQYYLPGKGGEIPIMVDGGNYNQPDANNSFYWAPNNDGTISLKNYYDNQYFCVDSRYGNNPALVYANRSSVGGSWEKFYCEVADAPIGCVVAFKSLNPNCIDNNDNQGQMYFCVNSNMELYANRAAVGGSWEKFLVVDAGNGYIALKSLRNNKYLSFENATGRIEAYYPGKVFLSEISDIAKFQWQNNGDGTISLKSVKFQKYICADSHYGNDPVKIYASRDAVGGSWEKFYCQVIQ